MTSLHKFMNNNVHLEKFFQRNKFEINFLSLIGTDVTRNKINSTFNNKKDMVILPDNLCFFIFLFFRNLYILLNIFNFFLDSSTSSEFYFVSIVLNFAPAILTNALISYWYLKVILNIIQKSVLNRSCLYVLNKLHNVWILTFN